MLIPGHEPRSAKKDDLRGEDLLVMVDDGSPVPVRVETTTAAAENGAGLQSIDRETSSSYRVISREFSRHVAPGEA